MTTYSAVSSDLTSFLSAKSLPLDSPAARSRHMSSRSLYLESLISVISIPPYTYMGRHGEEVPKSIENVFIDPTVKVVGEKAFSGCTKLGSIVIPSSVTVIDQNAFYGCTSLTSIVIPESVTTIASYAFHGCTSLSPVVIPSSVKSIGRNAFYRCTSLETLVIPESVTSMGELAFSECTSLKSVTLPSSIATIAWGAFSRCSSLAAVAIPDGVTAIDWGAFAECPSLASVLLPAGVKYIGESAFEGCTSLSMVAIPERLPCVGDRCFGECPLLQVGALKLGTDVFGWLRTRFDFMHSHQVCYKADVTKEKLTACLESFPDSVKARDSLGMSALHVLLMNEKVQPEMVELLLNARPALAMDVGLHGMYPLHYACTIPHVPLSVIKVLSNSYTMDGRLILTVRDDNNYLPCDLAIKYDRSDEIILHLFERHPTEASIRMTKEELDKLDNIHEQYITKLSEETAASIKAFDTLQRHGWVSFAIGAQDGSIIARKCIQFIETRPLNIIKDLALYRDLSGRSAIQNAPRSIKNALQKRLLILDRFEVDKKNLLHKTANSIIMKAIDRKEDETFRKAFEMVLLDESRTGQPRSIGENGFRTLLNRFGHRFDEQLFRKTFDRWKSERDSRISEARFIEFCKNTFNNGPSHEVVLKLMTDTAQFRREIDLRERLNFDSKYIVCVNNNYSYDTHGTTFANGLQLLSDEGYVDFRKFEHAIVMPLAGQNLDSIVRNERPPPHEVRVLAKQLAEAIAHVHSKGIIHGDLKLQHVVRFGDRLRLIDFGAAVEVGSYLGSKFSSGVLPPEMIVKLSMHECGCFKNYFKEVKRTDPVGWLKIDPKRVGATTFFAVKTYLQREVNASVHGNEDGDRAGAAIENTATSYARYEPVFDRPLPYHLVTASESIDVWSFGVTLYSLLTGSSLFDVDRDDDLKSGQAMQELYDWNESQKLSKLKNVSDPLAHRLLRKVLSRKPSDRYQSIEEMLQDDYFSDGYAANSLYDSAELAFDVISRVTIELRQARGEMVALIRNSVSVAFTSCLDGSEVTSPTCFVILPYTTPPYCGSEFAVESGSGGMESDCDKAFGYIDYVLDKVLSCINAPADFVVEYMKSSYVESTMYLFLVDESTGQSVCFDDVYPLEVDVQSAEVQAFLPLMAVVIRVLAVTKGVAGIMRLFLPGMPRDEIPANLWAKVEGFVAECTKANTTNIGVWGSELRLLGSFLMDQDAHCTFSDLRRILDVSSGMSMWVSSESGQRIEQGNFFDESCNEREEWRVEMDALRSKIKSLSYENHNLVSANGELTEKVKELSQIAEDVKVPDKIVDSSSGANEVEQLKEEKLALLDEIRALSLVNSSLEATKISVEETLRVTAEGVKSLQAAIVDHPKEDHNELRRMKRDQKDLVEAIRALALANSKLAWRPRCSG